MGIRRPKGYVELDENGREKFNNNFGKSIDELANEQQKQFKEDDETQAELDKLFGKETNDSFKNAFYENLPKDVNGNPIDNHKVTIVNGTPSPMKKK